MSTLALSSDVWQQHLKTRVIPFQPFLWVVEISTMNHYPRQQMMEEEEIQQSHFLYCSSTLPAWKAPANSLTYCQCFRGGLTQEISMAMILCPLPWSKTEGRDLCAAERFPKLLQYRMPCLNFQLTVTVTPFYLLHSTSLQYSFIFT